MGRRFLLSVAFTLALVCVADASASQLIDRNASGVRLAVTARGEALLTYRARGGVHHVRAWGAINARYPNPHVRQVKLHLDYAAGWGAFRRDYSKHFKNACRAYDGPNLPWLISACKAPDGSYWALQSWQVGLPDLGFVPWLPQQKYWELHVSHWTGTLAKLEVWSKWIYSKHFHELFGRLSYHGKPVYGYGTTN